ncbi:hypothetical protein HDC92_000601 [Pedobacter sp. AK017]|uniref:DUF6520 family protein n=1 Tax=Pedobacter sp. AK017 TaxID=2723073 RepID=UPI0016155465|nr:DUF6520 family protein [Pedobacter sp. AK017]MBB5436937.1 hypothetical protein [Pedobacter sp. AK017]
MKKLKIALAAIAFVAVAGGSFATQAKKVAAPCTDEQIETCTGNNAICCELPDQSVLRFVLPQQ